MQESLKNPMCVNYFMHVSSKIYDKSSKSWSLQHQILFWSPFCFLPSSFAFLESQNHSFPGFVPICPLLDPFLDHLFVYFLAVLHISRSQKRSQKKRDGHRTNERTDAHRIFEALLHKSPFGAIKKHWIATQTR